jgi:hypothetical protein
MAPTEVKACTRFTHFVVDMVCEHKADELDAAEPRMIAQIASTVNFHKYQ